MRRRPNPTAALLLAAAAVACPAAAWAGGPVRIGEQGGLGLWGPEIPDILKQAKLDPYSVPAEPSCAALDTELDALDEALGPDADRPGEKRNQAAKLLTKAVRGLIPHRDVVRFVTGAGKKEGALQQAAMAGWARRGFLRGVSHQMGCGVDVKVAAAPPALAIPTPEPLEAPPLAPAADAVAVPVYDTVPATPDVRPEPLRIQTLVAVEPADVAVNP